MKRIALCVMMVLLMVGVSQARWTRHVTKNTVTTTTMSELATVDENPTYEIEKTIVEKVNVERARYGLRPLILDGALLLRARQHCGWMANTRLFQHSRRGPENIAMGQPDVESVMHAWMNSSGHRANILNPGYTKIGVSAYRGPGGTVYWVQQFN